jgi:hypothetical protein
MNIKNCPFSTKTQLPRHSLVYSTGPRCKFNALIIIKIGFIGGEFEQKFLQ